MRKRFLEDRPPGLSWPAAVPAVEHDWLRDVNSKPLFEEIVGLFDHPKLLGSEIIAAQAFNIFERIQELELLIRVSNYARISTQQISKRSKRPALAPSVDQGVKCFE